MNEQAYLNEQLSGAQKVTGKAPKALIILSLVCLVFAIFSDSIAVIFSFVDSLSYSDILHAIPWLFSDLAGVACWSLCGLFLPVCLMLLSSSSKKVGLSKLFIGISVLFLLGQLLGAGFLAITTLAEDYFGVFLGSNVFPGWGVLYDLLYFIENIDVIRYVPLRYLPYLFYSFSNLFYIFVNVFCTFGFIKLAFSKK